MFTHLKTDGVRAISAVLLIAAAVVATGTTSSAAAPLCAALPEGHAVKVGQVPGWAESIAVDQRGRMFATELFSGRIYRLDHPGANAVPITGNVAAKGGIVVADDGTLVVGSHNGDVQVDRASLLRVDPDSGAITEFARGLHPVNGIAAAPDGSIYTSSFPLNYIGKVTSAGNVVRQWAAIGSANGLAVSRDGRYVYANQSAPGLNPVYRIPTDAPAQAHPFARVDALDRVAVPDGMTSDSRNRLIIAASLRGQVWRVDPATGTVCVLANNQFLATQPTYGAGDRGFLRGHLYVANQTGGIYEIPTGFDNGERGS